MAFRYLPHRSLGYLLGGDPQTPDAGFARKAVVALACVASPARPWWLLTGGGSPAGPWWIPVDFAHPGAGNRSSLRGV